MLVSPWFYAGAGVARAAVTPGDVEESAVWGGPRLLDEAWKHQGRLPTQRRALHVDPERDQLFAYGGVHRDARRCVRRALGGHRHKTHRDDRRPDADASHTCWHNRHAADSNAEGR